MVDIYDFPDGRLEVRWKGRSLPYSAFDKLQRVSHAAIVENKRLGEILAWIKEQQDLQPRFNQVLDGPRRSSQKPGILKNRALQIAEAAKSKSIAPSARSAFGHFSDMRTASSDVRSRVPGKPDLRAVSSAFDPDRTYTQTTI
jgi:hypothetical protein